MSSVVATGWRMKGAGDAAVHRLSSRLAVASIVTGVPGCSRIGADVMTLSPSFTPLSITGGLEVLARDRHRSQRRAVLIVDDIDEKAALAVLDRRGRARRGRPCRRRPSVASSPPGPATARDPCSRIPPSDGSCRSPRRPGCRSGSACRSPRTWLPSEVLATSSGAPAASICVELRDLLLGRGEDDRDRLQLGDRHDAGLLRGGDDIALVDQAEAGAAGDRRADRRIVELHLRGVDRRRVRRDLRDQLVDQRILRVELLLGREILLGERRIALQVEPGVGEIGLVLRSSWPWPGRAPPGTAVGRSAPADRPR